MAVALPPDWFVVIGIIDGGTDDSNDPAVGHVFDVPELCYQTL